MRRQGLRLIMAVSLCSTLGAKAAQRHVLVRAFLWLLLSALPLAATAQQADTETQTAAAQWNRYATAMARHDPLSRVRGAPGDAICKDSASSKLPEAYAEALAYAQEMQSYSLIVWQAGRCTLTHYFPPYSASLRPESASMHKSVVGLLLAAAIADGHIDSADDRIGKYLPAWSDDPRGDITLRQIATMASGLEPLSVVGGAQSPAVSYIFGLGDARQTTLGRPLQHTPNTVFYYAGFNTQLLLMAIESATGEAYTDYLSRRLWQRIGARDAFTWDYAPPVSMPRAYSALLATAEDWLRVGLLIKDRGRFDGDQVIPRQLMDELTAPGDTNPNYGWQLWLGNLYQAQRYYNEQQAGPSVPMSEPFATDDMIFFDGFGGQRVYISRAHDLVIVRQGEMRIDWDDAVLPNLIINARSE